MACGGGSSPNSREFTVHAKKLPLQNFDFINTIGTFQTSGSTSSVSPRAHLTGAPEGKDWPLVALSAYHGSTYRLGPPTPRSVREAFFRRIRDTWKCIEKPHFGGPHVVPMPVLR